MRITNLDILKKFFNNVTFLELDDAYRIIEDDREFILEFFLGEFDVKGWDIYEIIEVHPEERIKKLFLTFEGELVDAISVVMERLQ